MAIVGIGRYSLGLAIALRDLGSRLINVDVCNLVLIVGGLDRGLDTHGRVILCIALARMQRVPSSASTLLLVCAYCKGGKERANKALPDLHGREIGKICVRRCSLTRRNGAVCLFRVTRLRSHAPTDGRCHCTLMRRGDLEREIQGYRQNCLPLRRDGTISD